MKIYLAGPDVFFPNPLARGQLLREVCAAYGFAGIFPMDPAPQPVMGAIAASAAIAPIVAPTVAPTPESAAHIYRANVELIRGADAVLANLQDFRGYEPDSGTAFEVGFAAALGRPVWGYGMPSQVILEQVPHDGTGHDASGWQVEDFGLPRNLMLACSARLVEGGVRACLDDMRAVLLARARPFAPGWIRSANAG